MPYGLGRVSRSHPGTDSCAAARNRRPLATRCHELCLSDLAGDSGRGGPHAGGRDADRLLEAGRAPAPRLIKTTATDAEERSPLPEEKRVHLGPIHIMLWG